VQIGYQKHKFKKVNKNIFVLIGVCVLAFLVGIRLKKALGNKKKDSNKKINKNQRGKVAYEIPEEHKERPGKAKTKRVFTWMVVGVLFVLVLYMIPALIRDIVMVEEVYSPTLFLRLVIIVFALFTMISGYLKLTRKKK